MAGLWDQLFGSAPQSSERQLTPTDMYQYIFRTPDLRQQYFSPGNQPGAPPVTPSAGQLLSEAAAAGDTFGITRAQRLLGIPINPMVLLNESHGLVDTKHRR